ncbi:MAG: winged helix DNA-binding protein [Phycisphaerae bacterium]|nr:winged helix DNA-binding protein [Phycisphaerae bacterium]
MENNLVKVISELSLRMRLIKSIQEDKSSSSELTDRELLLLELLDKAGTMTISQIAALYPNVSESTISTTITKLWRDRKVVSKTISPENQRVTNVELTEKGKKELKVYAEHQVFRYKALLKAMQITASEGEVLFEVMSRAVKVFDSHLSKDNAAGEIIK